MRERLSLLAFLGTEDIEVHIVHISHVSITLFIGIIIFPHIGNPQSIGYNQPKKKTIEIITEKSEGPINSYCVVIINRQAPEHPKAIRTIINAIWGNNLQVHQIH